MGFLKMQRYASAPLKTAQQLVFKWFRYVKFTVYCF